VKSARLNSISGSPPNLEHLPKGCAFHPRCAYRFERCFAEVPMLMEFGEGSRRKACHYPDRLIAAEDVA
jgi:oligopeptide transport system ATP-binding protein